MDRTHFGSAFIQRWKLAPTLLCGTQSRVRVCSSLSETWFDSSIAQHLVLSPLLLMLRADSLLDLQDALDAVSELELQMALYLWQLLQTKPHSDRWPSFPRPLTRRHFGRHSVACCRWRHGGPPVSRGGWRCASIRLLPFDRWTALCGFTKRCGFPQTWSDAQHLCAERLLSLSLLGALSPCPTVNAALCPRLSSALPSPSRVHNCPIVSHSAVHRVFFTPQPAVLALSLFYFRVQALFQTHAPLSPCCWCFLLSHGPLLPLARTRLSVGALAGLTTRFHDVGLRSTRGSHCRTLWAKLPQATSSAVCWNVSPCRQLCRAFFQIPLFTLQG